MTEQTSAADILTALASTKNTHDDSKFDYQKSDLHGKPVTELESLLSKIESDTSIKVSKNFKKRLARMIEYKKGKGLELKKARRARDREKNKTFRYKRKKNIYKFASQSPDTFDKNFHIVMDLTLDHLMDSSSLNDLARQLGFAYATNRNLDYSSNLWYCGMQERLKKIYSYQHDGWQNWDLNYTANSFEEIETNKSNIVYLSSDATETLSRPKRGEFYVIGGLVDRNAYKGFCHQKAKDLGLRTAKLPLSEHVSMEQLARPLTVNHVSDILCKLFEKIDKHDQKPLPQRKRRKVDENGETENDTTSETIIQKRDLSDEVLKSYWHEAIIETIPQRKNFKIVEDQS